MGTQRLVKSGDGTGAFLEPILPKSNGSGKSFWRDLSTLPKGRIPTCPLHKALIHALNYRGIPNSLQHSRHANPDGSVPAGRFWNEGVIPRTANIGVGKVSPAWALAGKSQTPPVRRFDNNW